MKKGFGLIFLFLVILSLSFISAFSLSDLWGKSTGNVVEGECVDSDGGIDYYVLGGCYDNLKYFAENPIYDACHPDKPNVLREVYCSEDGYCDNFEYTCPEYCVDGACSEVCIPESIETTCGDWVCGILLNNCGEEVVCGICEVNEICTFVMGNRICVCSPNCTGKTCGDDGCGGSCGNCGTAPCVENHCVWPACIPDCTGKTCGDDGCGGSCGTCGENETCIYNMTHYYVCVESLCTDTDGGWDYFVKGEVTDSNGSYIDTCIIEGSNTYLMEYWCHNNQMLSERVPCTCTEGSGACIVESPINNEEVEVEGDDVQVEEESISSSLEIIEENSTSYVQTSKGNQEIKISPEEAIANADKIENVVDITIIQEGDVAAYAISGTKQAKLFSVIPITAKVEQKISVDDGSIISTEKPWWSFLARGI